MTEFDSFLSVAKDQRERAEDRFSFLNSLSPYDNLRYPGVHEWYSYRLYMDAVENYIRGHFLATIILSSTFIENILGTLLLEQGSENMGAYQIIEDSVDEGILSEKQAQKLHKVRKLRNPVVHTRNPMNPESYQYRYIEEGKIPWELAKQDAKESIEAVFILVNNFYDENSSL